MVCIVVNKQKYYINAKPDGYVFTVGKHKVRIEIQRDNVKASFTAITSKYKPTNKEMLIMIKNLIQWTEMVKMTVPQIASKFKVSENDARRIKRDLIREWTKLVKLFKNEKTMKKFIEKIDTLLQL